MVADAADVALVSEASEAEAQAVAASEAEANEAEVEANEAFRHKVFLPADDGLAER